MAGIRYETTGVIVVGELIRFPRKQVGINLNRWAEPYAIAQDVLELVKCIRIHKSVLRGANDVLDAQDYKIRCLEATVYSQAEMIEVLKSELIRHSKMLDSIAKKEWRKTNEQK